MKQYYVGLELFDMRLTTLLLLTSVKLLKENINVIKVFGAYSEKLKIDWISRKLSRLVKCTQRDIEAAFTSTGQCQSQTKVWYNCYTNDDFKIMFSWEGLDWTVQYEEVVCQKNEIYTHCIGLQRLSRGSIQESMMDLLYNVQNSG